MSSEVAIRARGLGKRYPIFQRPSERLRQMLLGSERGEGFWAVRDVDLELHRGETVGIVGRNGSGKSTLLEMISGTLEPTAGRLEVNGRIAALLELGAGFNDEFTGRENIHLNAAILGMSSGEIDQRFERIEAFADIGRFIDQPVKTYSSGMYSRLAFAVAIHTDPEILIVDETLSVGDEAFQRKCFARIDGIKAAGGTILFVSHMSSAVVELCDRALLLEGGEHLLTGSPKAVVTLYQKLLYASDEQAAAVRDEIRREHDSPGSLDAAFPGAQAEPAGEPTPEAATDPEANEETEDPAYFDPFLESKSTLPYEPNGARIENPAVLTLDHEPVNCLSANRRYLFRYEVVFERDAWDVRYHTLMKTVVGLELGGGTSPRLGEVGASVAKDEVAVVEFEFTCSLNSGVYFLNCGVTGCGGEQLHRIIDAIAIRVLPMDEVTTFGHVHLGFQATVRGEGDDPVE